MRIVQNVRATELHRIANDPRYVDHELERAVAITEVSAAMNNVEQVFQLEYDNATEQP